MKKKLLISVVVVCIIGVAIIGVVCVRKNTPQTVLSEVYTDKKYIETINSVELTDSLAAVVDEKDLYKVKIAVLENEITPENEERIAALIEEYSVESVLSGYSYLNADFVTWDSLEELVKEIDDKGAAKAIKKYDENAKVYVPSTFKRSQLEEWINVKGYPAADITALDKLAKLYSQDFDELMKRYENGTTISEIKAEVGLVNTSNMPNFVTIDEKDVIALAEKFRIDENRAEAVLADLVRLKFDTEKIGKIDCSDEYELLEMVLQQKYGGEGK